MSARKSPRSKRVPAGDDISLRPHGSATYAKTERGTHIFVFNQLGDLDPSVRGSAVALMQMSGFMPDLEPDADLVKFIEV